MVVAERIKRVLLSLPDASLRVGWLLDNLTRLPPNEAAAALDDLARQNEAADPAAKEAMLAVAMLLASDPESSLVAMLRRETAAQRLFSLARPLRRAPKPVVQALPAKDLPVPDYGTGRELTLGERRSLARRPNRAHFDKLLSDPHPMVIQQLLQNPKITEEDVVRLVTIRPARAEVMREVVLSHRWLRRSRVRLAILLNPGSPPEIVMPLVPLCSRPELRELVGSTDTSVVLRATALELLERRPPMEGEAATATVQ